jgi:hypothetical protein
MAVRTITRDFDTRNSVNDDATHRVNDHCQRSRDSSVNDVVKPHTPSPTNLSRAFRRAIAQRRASANVLDGRRRAVNGAMANAEEASPPTA